MNILNKLGLVKEVEVEEKTTKQNSSENKTETKQGSATESKKPSIFFTSAVNSTPGQVIGKIDNDIYEKLSVAIEENNLDGNDFFEFMQSLNKMSSLSVDEKTKFNMVFATLANSSGGMTKEHLTESIDHYIDVIDNEKAVFQKEMGKATVEMVDKKESYIEQLSKTAQEKAAQIQKLTQEIQEISNTVATTKAEVEQSKFAIAQKQADFDITIQQLENQILGYKEKINQHIQ
jgi:hypothetical protein